MARQTLSAAFLTAAILFAALALLTLIPVSSPRLSDLGYHAFCPFAPWSTLVLLFIAAVSWALCGHLKQGRGA
jgi:hypothetical protein